VEKSKTLADRSRPVPTGLDSSRLVPTGSRPRSQGPDRLRRAPTGLRQAPTTLRPGPDPDGPRSSQKPQKACRLTLT